MEPRSWWPSASKLDNFGSSNQRQFRLSDCQTGSYLLHFVVERLDLAKRYPRNDSRDKEFHSTCLAGLESRPSHARLRRQAPRFHQLPDSPEPFPAPAWRSHRRGARSGRLVSTFT
jgi:hypothetical protein